MIALCFLVSSNQNSVYLTSSNQELVINHKFDYAPRPGMKEWVFATARTYQQLGNPLLLKDVAFFNSAFGSRTLRNLQRKHLKSMCNGTTSFANMAPSMSL
jgi:hypothetical protein